MSKRDEFVLKMQTKLSQWNAEIDQLEERIRDKKDETKQQYQEQLENLKDKRDEVSRKLKEVQAASEDAWESLKVGTELVWGDMKLAFERVKNSISA